MKSKAEIEALCKKLINDRLGKKKKKMMAVCPHNCCHNVSQWIRGHGDVGFCNCGDVLKKLRNPIFVCNDENTAKRCKFYVSKFDSDYIEREFAQEIMNQAACSQQYPKLAALLWCLQDGSDSSVKLDDCIDRKKSFWNRLWSLFRG